MVRSLGTAGAGFDFDHLNRLAVYVHQHPPSLLPFPRTVRNSHLLSTISLLIANPLIPPSHQASPLALNPTGAYYPAR